ncbi:hypothetical protein GGR50DRAFT_271715 [Xylaria sp. CBS 124048]|nr:hypothetical protein GGR50DRAFT_271715 [Xylaria sp. CBS 124048]
MVILLRYLDGRPYSAWALPLYIVITPNAIISVLSIISRASLAYTLGEVMSQLKWLHILEKPDRLRDLQCYDDASRGPLGALKLFWRVRLASSTTYFSCLAILLSLAFEPFSQQLLQYRDGLTLSNSSSSSASFSTTYDSSLQGPGVEGLSSLNIQGNGLAAAVVNGIYDALGLPPFTCPLNMACVQFPNITSIGICSDFEDISSTITKTQLNNSITTSSGNLWAFRTPGNLTLHASAFANGNDLFHTTVNATSRVADNDALMMPLHVAIIRFPPRHQDTDPSNARGWVNTVQAYEGTFSFCGRRYYDWEVPGGKSGGLAGSVETFKLTRSDSPVDGKPSYRALVPPLNTREALGADRDSSFQINYLASRNISRILTSVLAVNDRETSRLIGVPALSSSRDIIRTMDNLADHVTYHMMAGPHATRLTGPAYWREKHIAVSWPFLVLPITLVIASSLGLGVVMVMTRRAQMLAWKSSLAPLVLPEAGTLARGAGRADGKEFRDYVVLRSRADMIAGHLRR